MKYIRGSFQFQLTLVSASILATGFPAVRSACEWSRDSHFGKQAADWNQGMQFCHHYPWRQRRCLPCWERCQACACPNQSCQSCWYNGLFVPISHLYSDFSTYSCWLWFYQFTLLNSGSLCLLIFIVFFIYLLNFLMNRHLKEMSKMVKNYVIALIIFMFVF